MEKLKATLGSRKFWATVVGLLVALGFLHYSESQQAELVSAVLTIVAAVFYTLGVALEDGLSKRKP